jgi:hypothetical protein
MANRAYLFNTSIPVCSRAQLDEALVRDGSPYAEVAEGANQIPVIWFFCFRREDLIPAAFSFRQNGSVVQQKVLLPCVPVEKAVRNLVEARAWFDAFVGDSALVEDYWQAAVESLQGLALPLLVMDPTEVFLLNDPEEDARTFVTALQGGEAAFEAIRQLSFYEQHQPPYAYKEFMSGAALDHRGRRRNSAALLGGFVVPRAVAVDAAPLPAPAPAPAPVSPDFTHRSVPSITVERAPSSISFDAAAAMASARRACAPRDSHEKKGEAKPKPWWKIW